MKKFGWYAIAITALAIGGIATGGGGRHGVAPLDRPTTSLDAHGKQACDEFAKWRADGSDPRTLEDVAYSLEGDAVLSHSGDLRNRSEDLRLAAVKGGPPSWDENGNRFWATCLRLGWTAN